MSVQRKVAELKPVEADIEWHGKPNEWLRRLAGPALSKTGVRLVAELIGGEENTSRSVAHKLSLGDQRIDVKVATLTNVGPYDAFVWRNIRGLSRLTHLALVAVLPSDAHAFVVPVSEIPSSVLKDTNVRNEYQIVITGAGFPAWLEAYAIECPP